MRHHRLSERPAGEDPEAPEQQARGGQAGDDHRPQDDVEPEPRRVGQGPAQGQHDQGVAGHVGDGGDPDVALRPQRLGRHHLQGVGDEEQAAVFKGEAAALAEAILYDKGNAYDDADPAKDRIASYGLAALAAGVVAKKATGAAAAAAATAKHAGIFSLLGLALMKLWTLLLVGLLLAAAALWLRSKRRGAPAAPPAPGDDSPQSTLRSRLAALWRKAAALRRKISTSKISPIMQGPKVASQAKALAKVATIMRKKAPEEPASAPVDLSRVTGRSSLSTGGPGQTPLAKETGAAQAGDRSHSLAAFTGEDNLGLVEPGDKAAASLAISARAAFKEQRRQA